ncbi:hypothetical protein [Lysinibacillus sp. FSL M8-0355]|uniref:hypothetical protein n=1 Tax=Lysinibacillus sp. FSL M8-0355 TaxID=2921719 RepID=UPI0030F4B7B4
MKQKQRATIFLKIVTILLGMPALALGLCWLLDMANRDAVAHLESAYLSYLLCLSMCSLLHCVISSLSSLNQHRPA